LKLRPNISTEGFANMPDADVPNVAIAPSVGIFRRVDDALIVDRSTLD